MSEPQLPLEPEDILDLMAQRRVLTPERLEIARGLSRQLARDPEMLASIERMLRANAVDINRYLPNPDDAGAVLFDDQTLGDGDELSITPKQTAAAAAAGAAAMLVGCIPVPV
jgi:hypothetical protein